MFNIGNNVVISKRNFFRKSEILKGKIKEIKKSCYENYLEMEYTDIKYVIELENGKCINISINEDEPNWGRYKFITE